MRQFLICSCFLNQSVPKIRSLLLLTAKTCVCHNLCRTSKKTQHSDTKTKTAEIHEKNLAGTLEKSLHFGGKIHLLRPKAQMFPSAICPHVAQTSRVLSEIPLFTTSKNTKFSTSSQNDKWDRVVGCKGPPPTSKGRRLGGQGRGRNRTGGMSNARAPQPRKQGAGSPQWGQWGGRTGVGEAAASGGNSYTQTHCGKFIKGRQKSGKK